MEGPRMKEGRERPPFSHAQRTPGGSRRASRRLPGVRLRPCAGANGDVRTFGRWGTLSDGATAATTTLCRLASLLPSQRLVKGSGRGSATGGGAFFRFRRRAPPLHRVPPAVGAAGDATQPRALVQRQ